MPGPRPGLTTGSISLLARHAACYSPGPITPPGTSTSVRVTNRHVIYVQGYDPRGLAPYYRMFRTELRKFDRLYGVTSSIGRPKSVIEGEIDSWSIETKAP